MSNANQGTLRDYLRVLRGNRWMIAAVTLVFVGLAAARSLSQESAYVATARVTFQGASQSNAEAGLAAVQTLTAAQLAAEGASTILSSNVLQRAVRQLPGQLTIAQARGMLKTSVDASSALVAVQATAGDGRLAAALANAVANTAVTIQTRSERERFATTATTVERQFETLRAKGKSSTGTEVALAGLLDRISTLRTLSLNATPVRLAETATVPSAPASPKPLRSTFFGGLIGLMLGIGLAFMRDSLDRRLRDFGEIQETLDLPIVGNVRDEALGAAACVSNGRGPMADQDIESFRILRTNLEFLVDGPVKTTLVTSPLPGEGKSTVAASLAAAHALVGQRTLLIECDLRRPCLSGRLSINRSPGLSDYLVGEADPAEVVQVVTLSGAGIRRNGGNGGAPLTVETETGELVVITAGSQSVRPAELLGSPRFREFLEEVAVAYDAVVIDTPPLLSVSDTLEIVPLADRVLVCIRAEQTTRDQARAVKDALAHLPERTTAVVITGLKPGREADYGYYSHAYAETG